MFDLTASYCTCLSLLVSFPLIVGASWVQWPFNILEHALLDLNSKSLVFFFVKPDQQLACIDGGLATAPLHEVLETFWILKNGADGAQAHSSETLFAGLSQVQENINTLNIQEM